MAALAVARSKVAEQWHGAGTQPFVPGAMRFIYEACESFKIEPVAGYELHCMRNGDASLDPPCLVSYRPLARKNPETCVLAVVCDK